MNSLRKYGNQYPRTDWYFLPHVDPLYLDIRFKLQCEGSAPIKQRSKVYLDPNWTADLLPKMLKWPSFLLCKCQIRYCVWKSIYLRKGQLFFLWGYYIVLGDNCSFAFIWFPIFTPIWLSEIVGRIYCIRLWNMLNIHSILACWIIEYINFVFY